MGNVYKKKFMVATCKHCGKVTNISESKDVKALVVHHTTLKEEIRLREGNLKRLHMVKNGQVQALHSMIGKLWDLLNPTQRSMAMKLNQSFRDEVNKLKKNLD